MRPIVITQTPFRISFFGGGTDFPGFYQEHGGSVISTSIDKFCNITSRHLPPFFDYSSELVYSTREHVSSVDEIKHPLIRETMRWMNVKKIYVAYDADLPGRSGLGTSSSFAVGMINAFYTLDGKYVDKKQLAKDAIYVERVLCKESGGIQDQIAAAYGGLNRIDFKQDGFNVRPIIISNQRKCKLNDHLMLFFTGFSRFSSDVSVEHEKAIKSKTNELLEILSLVDEAEKVLTGNGDLCQFGRLLDYTWKLKRGLTSKVTTNAIDAVYDTAMKAGAVGGKLLGAGGGGFFLFFVEPDKRKNVLEALSSFMEVPFKFEDGGTRVLYYTPED